MKKFILEKPENDIYKNRPCPEWFKDAKLGIFIHWGPYSVPGWAPKGESALPLLVNEFVKQGYDVDSVNTLADLLGKFLLGYVKRLQFGKIFKMFKLLKINSYSEWYWNSIASSKVYKEYHKRVWKDKDYTEFGKDFDDAVKDWNPDTWTNLFDEIGAKYMTITSKHHDGYCLWPTVHKNPQVKNWHSSRDLIGDLNQSLKSKDIRLAIYYSAGYDWALSGVPIKTMNTTDYFANSKDELEYVDNQVMELIDRYKPSVLWEDIGYSKNGNFEKILDYYYDKVSDGLVNDRAQPGLTTPATRHFDFTTTEYFVPQSIRETPWETCRGISDSFGYNRNDDETSCLSAAELVESFADIISKNGNLMLGLGPMADGTIPEYQVEVVREFGEWVKTNSDAIYGTRPFERFNDKTLLGNEVRYTTKDGKLNAIVIGSVHGDVEFENIKITNGAKVTMLGKGELRHNGKGGVIADEISDKLGCVIQFNISDIKV